MRNLASVLKKARLDKGLTIRAMDLMGQGSITYQTVLNCEKPGYRPSPEKLRPIAKMLGLDFLEVMILAGHINREELMKSPLVRVVK